MLERVLAMASELLKPKPMALEEVSTGCSDGETAVGDYDKVLAEQQDLARTLSDDVLADVFRHLPPRWLAVCRCVCRDWRAAIDARRLLRADLLPLSVRGIFLHFDHHMFPEFFARPSSSTVISGKLDFLPFLPKIGIDCEYYQDWNWDKCEIRNHCNGLLLLNDYVVNPATRRWDPLPPHPRAPKPVVQMDGYSHTTFMKYLAFDPTLSPHYEVVMIPHLYTRNCTDYFDPLVQKPSSPCILRVFSSRSGNWELKSFVGAEGDAVGTVINDRSLDLQQCAVYWRGALYVQREANFVVRISLSNNKYLVIRPPMGMRGSIHSTRRLDRSEKGVYFATLDNYRLRVWILNESSGQREWMLKHDQGLEPVLARYRQVHGPWMLKDVNYNSCYSHLPKYKKNDIVEQKLEWNSDSDDLDDIKIEGYLSGENKKAMGKRKIDSLCIDECDVYKEPFLYVPEIRILGFHPYREVVFLSDSLENGLAYHLSTSKVEGLGNIYPTNYIRFKIFPEDVPSINYSFTYTPCWLEEFPRNR